MNIAYIDNQNLYMSTEKHEECPWTLDMKKLRELLLKKYRCEVAYLFMGAYKQDQAQRYAHFQRFGYVLMFREHSKYAQGAKKGNVDTDIVFQVMHDIIEEPDLEKVVLVSGDGDYKKMVDYLIEKDKFEKILHPSKNRASSLYKKVGNKYYAYLDTDDMRIRLGRENK